MNRLGINKEAQKPYTFRGFLNYSYRLFLTRSLSESSSNNNKNNNNNNNNNLITSRALFTFTDQQLLTTQKTTIKFKFVN